MISVIIVNWNTREHLRRCLQSIFENPANGPLEVIVVDNASSDGSQEMVKSLFPSVRLVCSDCNAGFARGNNIGFQHAQGNYLFILNPDTLVLPNCLDRLRAFLETHPEAGVVGPWIRNPACNDTFTDGWNNRFGRIRIPISLGVLFLSSAAPMHPVEVDWVLNAASFFRRRDVGRDYIMDETFFIGTEEIEFCCYWMRRKGLRSFLLPDAQIIHFVGQSYIGRLDRTVRLHGLAQAGIYFRRAQLYGPVWARLDSLVGLADHLALLAMVGIKNLFRPAPERVAAVAVYRALLRDNARLALMGSRESERIDREFRKWISQSGTGT